MPPAYLLLLAKIISSTMKMEAKCSSETSVETRETTRRHIPEDDTLYVLLVIPSHGKFAAVQTLLKPLL
jgi:hypothetical protein